MKDRNSLDFILYLPSSLLLYFSKAMPTWQLEGKLLLLLLNCFSRVRLCATLWTAAHQAPLSTDSLGKNTGVGCHVLLHLCCYYNKLCQI